MPSCQAGPRSTPTDRSAHRRLVFAFTASLLAACVGGCLIATPAWAQATQETETQAPAPAEPPPAQEAPAADAAPRVQANRHALGLSGGFTTGSGFAYRRYFGNTFVQLSGVAFVYDRGDQSMVLAGLSAAHYLVLWHRGATRGIIPNTTALRLVGGASFYQNRSSTQITNWINDDPTCNASLPPYNCSQHFQASTKKDRTSLVGAGLGIGFEFGAIMRPGFALSLDLMLTAAFDSQGLSFLLPLPAMALVYNW